MHVIYLVRSAVRQSCQQNQPFPSVPALVRGPPPPLRHVSTPFADGQPNCGGTIWAHLGCDWPPKPVRVRFDSWRPCYPADHYRPAGRGGTFSTEVASYCAGHRPCAASSAARTASASHSEAPALPGSRAAGDTPARRIFDRTEEAATPASSATSCTRALLGLEPRRPRYHLRVAAFYGALLWLGAHMTSGKWGVTIWAAGDPILDLGDGD